MASEAGPAINPIEQFYISPIVPIQIAGHDFSLTNSSLYMLIAVALACALMAVGARRRRQDPRTPAGARRDGLRIRRRHGALGGRRDGHALLPAGVQPVHVHSHLQSRRPDPLFLHRDQPHHHHGGAGAAGVLHRHRSSASKEHGLHFFKLFVPSGVPIYILPLVVAIEVISFLSRPLEPFRASVRQHAGRPHHAQRVRRLRRHAAGRRRGASRRSRSCRSR